MSINWQDREIKTRNCEIVIRAMLNKWLEDDNDWMGEVVFLNYPPVLYLRMEIPYLNSLPDLKLRQVGDFVTGICSITGVVCSKGFKTSKNSIEYKLYIPFS